MLEKTSSLLFDITVKPRGQRPARLCVRAAPAAHRAARWPRDLTNDDEQLRPWTTSAGLAGQLSSGRLPPVPNRWACAPWGPRRPHHP